MNLGNMYEDSVYQWNVFVGCRYGCKYCERSFQRQMKRQKPVIDKKGRSRGCEKCYLYQPHFHKERLEKDYLRRNLENKRTYGDQYIWCSSSSDLAFAPYGVIEAILNVIRVYPDKTFLLQTKNPFWMIFFDFPQNVLLGITLETNYIAGYNNISFAPEPYTRIRYFKKVRHPKKIITIEPILTFGLHPFVKEIYDIAPERVYIGYDTKNCKLPEPPLKETNDLIGELENFTKVKQKLIRKAWYETQPI